ncbi:hypothetical protein JTE90_022244 [Oedothorax gibbosus]|uniref:Uncharacterized protein n=1 Tax=Oedothorax gibbosus TaxID=931172 RepID=A0AAV6VUK6_9ARAC|nr:hypothetical protein JTE90_022244 [Oedothorax gibbosus]
MVFQTTPLHPPPQIRDDSGIVRSNGLAFVLYNHQHPYTLRNNSTLSTKKISTPKRTSNPLKPNENHPILTIVGVESQQSISIDCGGLFEAWSGQTQLDRRRPQSRPAQSPGSLSSSPLKGLGPSPDDT